MKPQFSLVRDRRLRLVLVNYLHHFDLSDSLPPTRDQTAAMTPDIRSRINRYAAVGATASVPPSGYNFDHSRIKLGEGEAAFLLAKTAFQTWTQFHPGWVNAKPLESSIRVGGMMPASRHANVRQSRSSASVPPRSPGTAPVPMPSYLESTFARYRG